MGTESVKHTLTSHPFTITVMQNANTAQCLWAEEGGSKCYGLRNAKRHAGMRIKYLDQRPETVEIENRNPVQATDTIPAAMAWDAYSKKVRSLIIVKSQGYGDAWQRQGYMGNLARILSKTARLQNMAWKDGEEAVTLKGGEESILDTLRDLGALCAFMVANLEEANRWGR